MLAATNMLLAEEQVGLRKLEVEMAQAQVELQWQKEAAAGPFSPSARVERRNGVGWQSGGESFHKQFHKQFPVKISAYSTLYPVFEWHPRC